MKNDLIFVQWTNNFGGLEKLTQTIQQKITDFNLRVLVLMHNETGIVYKDEIKLQNEQPITKLYFSYFKTAEKHKRSIFHLNNAGSKILLATYVAGAKKIVYHFHGTKFSTGIFDKVVWKMLKNKVQVIANSTFLKTLIEQKLRLNNIHLIPNLIDTAKFTFTAKKNSTPFIITYAGRFTKGKNIHIILKTAKFFLQNSGEYEFRLYGDGPEKTKIEKAVREMNLSSIVKLYDFVEDIHEVYKNSNLFLFLSGYESFGNVVAEAILSGTPVLCYKIPALLDIVKQEYFFIQTLEPKKIAEKIKSMKSNYNYTLDELNKNHVTLKKYIDNDKIINQFKQIYNQMSN